MSKIEYSATEQKLRKKIRDFIQKELILARTPAYSLDADEQSYGIMHLIKSSLPELAKDVAIKEEKMTQENKARDEKALIELMAYELYIEVRQAKRAVEMMKEHGYQLIDPSKLTVLEDGDGVIEDLPENYPLLDFSMLGDYQHEVEVLLKSQLAHTLKQLDIGE